MSGADAVRLLARAKVIHLASVLPDGQPMLRTLHAVVHAGALYFHGAPAGEKLEAIGRPAVVTAEEVLAEIPSYFLDPERACPATTYYESAQAHGLVIEVSDEEEKAAALQALMEKYQPEGGHVPIAASDPLYKKAVNGVLVLRLALDKVDGKAKLGQNRGPADLAQVLEKLWERGLPEDPRAIDKVATRLVTAHGLVALPAFLRGPGETRLACALDERDLDAAVGLIRDAYWNDWPTEADLRRSHLGATAWVGIKDQAGTLLATARALSDGGKFALIYDVAVTEARRGQGLGEAMLRFLLAHPRLRQAQRIWLKTRDAMDFYRRFGFVLASELPPRSFASNEMWLLRPR